MSAKPHFIILAVIVACGVTGFAGVAGLQSSDDAPARATARAISPLAASANVGPRVRYQGPRRPVLSLPGGEHRVVDSVLKIDTAMTFGSYVWDVDGVPPGAIWVRVDMDRQLISVFQGGHEIGAAVILYGARTHPSPSGVFTVQQKAEHYHSRTYDAPMPYMLRLTHDGVAIHGSDVREGWATHGCIGVPEAFARQLFSVMHEGDVVFILA